MNQIFFQIRTILKCPYFFLCLSWIYQASKTNTVGVTGPSDWQDQSSKLPSVLGTQWQWFIDTKGWDEGSLEARESLAVLGRARGGAGPQDWGVRFQNSDDQAFSFSPHSLKCPWGEGCSTWGLAKGLPWDILTGVHWQPWRYMEECGQGRVQWVQEGEEDRRTRGQNQNLECQNSRWSFFGLYQEGCVEKQRHWRWWCLANVSPGYGEGHLQGGWKVWERFRAYESGPSGGGEGCKT